MIEPIIIKNILQEVCINLKNLKLNSAIKHQIHGTQFKSNADLLANEIIKSHLKKHSPYPILSEEDKSSWRYIDSKLYWLIDPLDGNSKLLRRIPRVMYRRFVLWKILGQFLVLFMLLNLIYFFMQKKVRSFL